MTNDNNDKCYKKVQWKYGPLSQMTVPLHPLQHPIECLEMSPTQSLFMNCTLQFWWLWYWIAIIHVWSKITCQKLPWQRGIYEVIRWVRDHRFYLGSFWLARFMETAGAPDRFSWESQEFWAVKQHYLTIPQRGTVNPWTETKTRGTRWSLWLTYWKGIRWVSVCVCESFYYVTFAVCICMSCALKSLVCCSSIIPRRNVCIFTRLHKCGSVVLHFFCRELLLLHNNKSRRSTLLSADIWSNIKPHLHQKVSECVLAFLFILFNIHKCSPVTMFAIKISDVHCFADIGLIIITACQSGFDLQQELAKV